MEVAHTLRDGIAWSVQDQVARITLSRPERANAIDLPTALAFSEAIEVCLRAQPRVLVLDAIGPIFCAGGDIQSFAQAGPKLLQLVADILEPLLPAYRRLASAPCPVVTVVSGPFGGAGLGLALVGDVVLASTTVKLRTGYAALGLSPDVGASYFLARRVGAMRAQRWLMASQPVSAEECLAAGAVDALYPPEQLAAAADEWVQRLRQAAPQSMAAIKRLTANQNLPLADYLALEREMLENCAQTQDAQEGIAAFLAKRPPRFQGH
ncbi:MAG: enoyl-CoA hydratase [Limnohabitans sp.]|jgi:2-(1,2-epoxy-1,2-dihydrophenyl)acetyl-CoA isomerase|nr:enoyl-CoA hydratase [Limnohabitans sp.]